MTPKEKKVEAIVKKRSETGIVLPDASNLTALAKTFYESHMWPQLEQYGVAGIFSVIQFGQELGIPPITSLNSLPIINGRLGMSADAMLAVAHKRASLTWKIDEWTEKGCTMTFFRPGFEAQKITYDEKDARTAGLLEKDNWKKNPKAMYLSRCKSRGGRATCPDSLMNLYSVDEIQDEFINVNVFPEAGEIKEAEVVKEKEPQKESLSDIKSACKEVIKAAVDLEEPQPEPPKEQTELDFMKKEIDAALDTLAAKYNHPKADMIAKITERILKVFGRAVANVPADLTEKEAKVIKNALRATLDSEEEKERAQGGAL